MEDEDEGVLNVYTDGTKRWFDKKGRFHRINGPALIYRDGETRWYRHGQLHRDDGPAVIYTDGYHVWYRHGKLHRDDGPARIFPTEGIEYWYRNGEPYEPTAHEIMAWKLKKQQTSNTTQTNAF